MLLKIEDDSTLEIIDGGDNDILTTMITILKDIGKMRLSVKVSPTAEIMSFFWNLGFEPRNQELRLLMEKHTSLEVDQDFSRELSRYHNQYETQASHYIFEWTKGTRQHEYLHVGSNPA